MYSTLENLIGLIPEETLLQLTDDMDEGEFIIDPPNPPYIKVIGAIEKADNIINGVLYEKYTIPFAEPEPGLIVEISSDLAICHLYDRPHSLDIPEGIEARRKRAMKLLESIRDGKIKLPGLKVIKSTYLTNKTKDDIEFSDDLLRKF